MQRLLLNFDGIDAGITRLFARSFRVYVGSFELIPFFLPLAVDKENKRQYLVLAARYYRKS